MVSRVLSLSVLLSVSVMLAGCRGATSKEQPIVGIRNMYDQPKYDIQEESTFFTDHRTMRPLVEGVISREQEVDPTIAQGRLEDQSGYVLTVPSDVVTRLGGPEAMVARGRARYGIYCTPCHDGTGGGNGLVKKRAIASGATAFVPPTFHQDRLRHIPDGQLFATISNGKNNMPPYAMQIPVNDRWAIVSYVRALQVAQPLSSPGGSPGTPQGRDAVSKEKHSHPTASWVLSGPWAGAWKIFVAIGVVGLIGAGYGYTASPRRVAFAWMFAFITCLAIALGSMFFVLIQRLTSAGWSVTVRRTAEFFAYGILALIPLFIPILLSMGHLFPWLGGHGGHGAPQAPAGGHGSISLIAPAYAQTTPLGHGGNPGPDHDGINDSPRSPRSPHLPEPVAHAGGGGELHSGNASAQAHATHESHALIHAGVMAKKSEFLNKNFFLARALIYFLVWTVLAVRLFGYSAAQDTSRDAQLTVRAQRFAPAATFLFALTLTGAAVDWVMSLEPSWFSTIFGVYYFATGVVSSLATIILVTMALRTSGPLKGAVTPEHYHDLGKLMFGFLVFWAYIGFSQFMLIWYAALPEETTWYHNRWDFGPWAKVSMAILIGHFVIPFFWLISRNFKRNLGRLQIGAGILLVMHVVDMYWFVMPNFALGSNDFAFDPMIDVSCLLAVGGIYGAFVFFRMTKHSLVPVGDPRLERSLHFQNA